MRKIKEINADKPEFPSSMGEMIKFMRRSPIFRWADFVSFTRSAYANHMLLPQILLFDLATLSPKYEVPVHYILGEEDTTTLTQLAQAYYETIDAPCKSLTIIPGAGHNLMYERPQECAAALHVIRETLSGR